MSCLYLNASSSYLLFKWSSKLQCRMWKFCHPKSLSTTSCFTEHSEWWSASEPLDMFKTSNSLHQAGSFGSFWPFIVASWDTWRCCHEITLSGITGWWSTYLLLLKQFPGDYMMQDGELWSWPAKYHADKVMTFLRQHSMFYFLVRFPKIYGP